MPPYDERPAVPEILIAYAAMAVSGALVGFALGWLGWVVFG